MIYLCLAGGPSHLETFDYKPKLAEMHGQPMPESFTKGQPIAQLQGQELKCFGPQHPFSQLRRVRAGDLRRCFPQIGAVADEICIVRSMHTEQINHDPAHTFMNTGTTDLGPAGDGLVAAATGWAARRDDLPGFVVLTSQGQRRPGAADRRPAVAQRLPAQPLPGRRSSARKGDPVLYVRQPRGRRRAPQQRDAGRRGATR